MGGGAAQLERWNLFGAEVADAAIVVHAPDTSIVWSNRKAATLLGVARDNLTGKVATDPAFQLLDEDGEVLPLKQYPVMVALNTRARVEDYVVGARRPDIEGRVWLRITAEPVFEQDGGAGDNRGDLAAVVVTFVDITREIDAENERRKARARVEEATRLESLGLLAGGIAHDFNNLLVGILGAADSAHRQLDAPEDLDRLFDIIQDSASRAAELTRQLVNYAGRGAAVVELIDVDEAVGELVRIVRGGLLDGDRLEYSPGENVPPVEVDGSQFRQVLLNLLTNAGEAVANQPAPRVRVATERINFSQLELEAMAGEGPVGPYTVVTVSDNGCGMDEATRARIFEPFFTTKAEGHGLGLAAARGLVKSSGGFMRVQSAPNQGATFELGLPASNRGLVRRRRPDRTDTGRLGEGRRVLVVDDEPVVRKVLRRMLEKQGFVVETLDGGRNLLTEMARAKPHLLILDLTMPERGGAELLVDVRRDYPDLPVLLASGHADVGHRVSIEPGTPTGFLPKPFSVDELSQKLVDLLR